MLSYFREKEFLHPFCIWFVLLAWYIIIGSTIFFGFHFKCDNFITSQSFWFFSKTPVEAQEVVIVAIDQSSRQELGLKWPWKRSITAQLISNIAKQSPKAVGLDIVFSGYSEEQEDRALIDSLKSHPKIILGFILNENIREEPAPEFRDAAFDKGFVNRPLQGGIVRDIKPIFVDNEGKLDTSLDVSLMQAYLDVSHQELPVNEQGVRLNDKLFIPFSNGMTPLNYLVYHSNFNIVSASDVLSGKVPDSIFKDKIVLVGSTDPVIHDEYFTPLGIFPGVTIIGNSLVMLLSKRFIKDMTGFTSFLFAFLLGFMLIFISKGLSFLRSSICLIFMVVAAYFSLLYFRSMDMVFAYDLLIFSTISASLVFHFHKYTNIIYVSNKIRKQAVFDPATGLYTSRYFMLQLDEKLKSTSQVLFIGLQVKDYKKVTKDMTFEQIKELTLRLSSYLRTQLESKFKKTTISCLSSDIFGVLVEGEDKEHTTSLIVDVLQRVQAESFDINGKVLKIDLSGCLLYKQDKVILRKTDIFSQLKNLLHDKPGEDVSCQEMKEIQSEKENKEINYKNPLDFIAYDWEERNRELESNLKEILEVNNRLDRLNWGTLRALARAIDAKSPWTAGHSERVTQISLKIGRRLHLSHDELDNLHRAGLLHDIGKIGIPVSILDKTGKLSDEEYRRIKEHPAKGANILQPIEEYAEVIKIAIQHHERFDGKGYPKGLSGEEITLGGRIMAVADVFDALISHRPYRTGMTFEKALSIIKEGRGTQFDSNIVDIFMQLAQEEKLVDEMYE